MLLKKRLSRAKYSGCKLRVFFLSDKLEELDSEARNMASLLAKFRIDFQVKCQMSPINERSVHFS